MPRLVIALLAIPATTLLAYLALGGASPRADFVVAADELRTVDPAKVSWTDELQVAAAMFEGLTRTDPRTQLVEPGLAERWTFDPQTLTYTFHLRPGLRWSDGTPLVAEDVRYSWLRALDPQTQSQYVTMLYPIAGAEAFSRRGGGATPDPALVGIDVLDERTLRVRLGAPCSYFLELTAMPVMAPVQRACVKRFADGGGAGARDFLWTRPGKIVVSGAFTLVAWEFKNAIRLERNPWYWDAARVGVDSIEIYMPGNPNAALAAYQTGRVDLVKTIEPTVARQLEAERQAGRRGDYHNGERFATYFFRVNCRRPPLDDLRLRQALHLGIDREALCASVLGTGETPAGVYVPPSGAALMQRQTGDGRTVRYPSTEGLLARGGRRRSNEERIAAARALLDESGFAAQAATRPIELSYANDPPIQRRIAEAVQGMWERDLGIRVELRVQERKVLSARIRALDYDVVRSDWYGDYLDPTTFLEMFTSQSGQNRTGWSHPEYDRLLAAAAVERDEERRFTLLADAERILCERELPIIPLYFKRGQFLLNPRFANLHDNVRDLLPIHRVELAVRAAGDAR